MTNPRLHPLDHAQPHSFVVRIYRRTARAIVGQIEDVESGAVRAFSNAAELWTALKRLSRAGKTK